MSTFNCLVNHYTHHRLSARAKLNLFLAIRGLRPDGFHDLFSLAIQTQLADRLDMQWISDGTDQAVDQLFVESLFLKNGDRIPQDETNIAWRALQAFRSYYPFEGRIRLQLIKHIPSGAGLGGGSSDAAAVLKGLQHILNYPLSAKELSKLATSLGSDVPLFLENQPALLEGRGEIITPLDPSIIRVLDRQKILIFKPAFSISTAWAYQACRAQAAYLSDMDVQTAYHHFIDSLLNGRPDFFNTFTAVIGIKYPIIPLVLEELRYTYGVAAQMSGSGSACFVFLKDNIAVESIRATIQAALGQDVFCVESHLETFP